MNSAGARVGRLDITIVVVASVLGVGDMIWQVSDGDIQASALAAPAFLAITIPMLWRRAAPLYAAAAVLGALLLHVAAFGDLVRCGVVVPLALLLAFSAAARLPLRGALGGLGLTLGIDLAICLTDHSSGASPEAMAFLAPVTLLVWGTGRAVRSRGQIAEQLEARNVELRAARDERARMEVADDRARLSAELDELLQRRLGELAQLADAGPGEQGTSAALAEIEHASRSTLEEMREIVGVLRDDQAAPMAPQPALTQLEALLVRAKGSGARLRVEGSPCALPAGVELSAYRVVEYLLGAVEDADGVEVCVRFAQDALELVVTGPARSRAAGPAIERARERARLHSGTLEANTRDGRAQAVVRLPILAAV